MKTNGPIEFVSLDGEDKIISNIDEEINGDSKNPVANSAVFDALNEKADNIIATADVAGIVKLGSDAVQTVIANDVTATLERTYAVQLNEDGQMVVNVPWINTDIDVDNVLSKTSINPVQNCVITNKFDEKLSKSGDTMTGPLTVPQLLGVGESEGRGIIPVRYITRQELNVGVSDGVDAYIQAWLKKVCELYPNIEHTIYLGAGNPSSEIIIYGDIYNTSERNDDGMPRYCVGIAKQYGEPIRLFNVKEYVYDSCLTITTQGSQEINSKATVKAATGEVSMNLIREDNDIRINMDIAANGTDRGIWDKQKSWLVRTDGIDVYVDGVVPYSTKNPPPSAGPKDEGTVYGDTDLSNTAYGYNAKCSGSGGASVGNSIALGVNAVVSIYGSAGSSYTNNMALGYGASITTGNNTIQMGNSSISSFKCKVGVSTTSDERDKTDITVIDDEKALRFITQIDPIQYVDNDRNKYLLREKKIDEDTGEEVYDENGANNQDYMRYGMCEYDREAHARGDKKGERKRIGVKAQQVQQLLLDIFGSDNYANIVNDDYYDLRAAGNEPPVENHLTVTYERMIPFLIGAIKEQQKQIDYLKKCVEGLN